MNKKEVKIHKPQYWQDFMLDAEDYPNELVLVIDEIYNVSEDITQFVRDYGWTTYTGISNKLKELVANGLLSFVRKAESHEMD